MATQFEQAVDHAYYVSRLAGDETVNWVYNNTHGPIVDLAEVFTCTYNGILKNEERLLLDQWNEFNEKNKGNPHAKIFHVCHSKGAPHTRYALMSASEEVRDRVIVLALAPACPIPERLCHTSFNYAIKGDFVPCGELAYRGLFDSNEIGASAATLQAFEDFQEIVWLDPLPGSDNSAHDFQNPVFAELIEKHHKQYAKESE